MIAVDLGLPSGTLWGDRNIGANEPENTGDYFRFGEVVPFKGDSLPYKYEDLGEDYDVAGTERDAATVILGSEWHLPTEEQIRELHDCCTAQWETINGMEVLKVTGPNGNTIFFPLAGNLNKSGELSGNGKSGGIWSASYLSESTGRLLFWQPGYWNVDSCDCAYAFPIRPVINK